MALGMGEGGLHKANMQGSKATGAMVALVSEPQRFQMMANEKYRRIADNLEILGDPAKKAKLSPEELATIKEEAKADALSLVGGIAFKAFIDPKMALGTAGIGTLASGILAMPIFDEEEKDRIIKVWTEHTAANLILSHIDKSGEIRDALPVFGEKLSERISYTGNEEEEGVSWDMVINDLLRRENFALSVAANSYDKAVKSYEFFNAGNTLGSLLSLSKALPFFSGLASTVETGLLLSGKTDLGTTKTNWEVINRSGSYEQLDKAQESAKIGHLFSSRTVEGRRQINLLHKENRAKKYIAEVYRLQDKLMKEKNPKKRETIREEIANNREQFNQLTAIMTRIEHQPYAGKLGVKFTEEQIRERLAAEAKNKAEQLEKKARGSHSKRRYKEGKHAPNISPEKILYLLSTDGNNFREWVAVEGKKSPQKLQQALVQAWQKEEKYRRFDRREWQES